MKFRYKKFARGAYAPVLRPIIPIEISYGENSIKHEVLVDSGADMCLVDAEIGELLHIPIEDGERHLVTGVSGQPEPYYNHPVKIVIGGWEYEVEVGFKRNLSSDYGLAGQVGFFQFFTVKFDYQKEQIELKRKEEFGKPASLT